VDLDFRSKLEALHPTMGASSALLLNILFTNRKYSKTTKQNKIKPAKEQKDGTLMKYFSKRERKDCPENLEKRKPEKKLRTFQRLSAWYP
jgi:hypothetical protein